MALLRALVKLPVYPAAYSGLPARLVLTPMLGVVSDGGEVKMTEQKETLTTRPDVDEEGFLLHPKAWTEDVAQALTRGEIIGDLTEAHWKVIDCLRQYYLEFDTVPPVRLLVRQTGLSLRRIHKLFPNGVNQGACKVAGIPRHRVTLVNCAGA